MGAFVVVSYWWGNYKRLAERMSKTCIKMNIQSDLVYMKEFENRNYQLNINYKPTFIKKMILKHKKPVVYLDMDMKIMKYPELFEYMSYKGVDFGAFNWNADMRVFNVYDPFVFETSGGIMYFGNTKNALKLVDLWRLKLNSSKYKKCADDRVLSMAFDKSNGLKWCKCFWLPFEYIYIPDHFKGVLNMKDVVIMHNSKITSEETAAKKGAKDRIPSDYKIENKVKAQECLYINPVMKKLVHLRPLLKHLKRKLLYSQCSNKDVYKKLLKVQELM